MRELQDVDGSRCLSSSLKRAARRLVVVDRHAASDSCPTGVDSPPPPPPILPFWLVLWPRGAKMTHGGRWRQRHRWTAKSLSFPTVYCAAPGASSKVARQASLYANQYGVFISNTEPTRYGAGGLTAPVGSNKTTRWMASGGKMKATPPMLNPTINTVPVFPSSRLPVLPSFRLPVLSRLVPSCPVL